MELNQKDEPDLILGIDDAGRGPMIGAMALAGCLVTKELEDEFKKLGVKDSKLVQPNKREILADEIRKKAVAFHVVLRHPYEIDHSINTGTNLNKVEALMAAEIINKLVENRNEKIRVIIDCPSPNRESWRRYVVEHIMSMDNLAVVCEHKADRDYVAVSAASILAKSERERDVARLKQKIGKDFGSGYPSDPVSVEFLKKYFEEHKKDGIFRETWAPLLNNKKQKEQKKLGEF
jgi:ribonuclease HII